MKSVRKALKGTVDSNCCAAHGDLASGNTASGVLLAHHRVEMKVPRGKPLSIPTELVASTTFWERHLQGRIDVAKPLVITSHRVCNLHQKDECKYGADCNNIHICREFWPFHAKQFVSQKQQGGMEKCKEAPKSVDPKFGKASSQQIVGPLKAHHLPANDAHALGHPSLSSVKFGDSVARVEERCDKSSDTLSCITSEAGSVEHCCSPNLSSTTPTDCSLVAVAACMETSMNTERVEPQPIDQCMETMWRTESLKSIGSPLTPMGKVRDELSRILVREDNVTPRLEKYLKCSTSSPEPCVVEHSNDSFIAMPQTCNLPAFDWGNANATSRRRLRGVAVTGNMLRVEFTQGPDASPGFAIGRGRHDDQTGQQGWMMPSKREVHAKGNNTDQHPLLVPMQPKRLSHIYRS